MAMSFQVERSSDIKPRYLVGDSVEVLDANHLPIREKVLGRGIVERISHGNNGEVVYFISGFNWGHPARVLRLILRGGGK